MAAVAPQAPARAASQPAARHQADRSGPLRRIAAQGTPRTIQALIIILMLLSFAWGGLGAWTVAEHSGAAGSLAHADGPSSYDAQQLYLNLANADVTITTSFLAQAQSAPAGAQPASSLAARQQFETYLTDASRDLAAIQDSNTSPRFTADVAAIVNGLAQYKGDVASAQAQYALGYIPTGDSFMEVASEDAHLTLLPSAQDIYRIENGAVTGSKGQATSLATLLITLVVAIVALYALVRTQRWLARKTRRVLNVGLLIATAALVISGVWLVITAVLVGSDLSTAIGQGANPASQLAQASIDVQQIRGDSILNVIARSGSTSLPADSQNQQNNVGHSDTGNGLLAQALAAGNGQATPYVRAAISAAPAWYALNNQGYTFDSKHNFAGEQTAVNEATGGYKQLKADISNALVATQSTFTSNADAGARAFGALEAVVIIAALVMALTCAWGLSQRLREYRLPEERLASRRRQGPLAVGVGAERVQGVAQPGEVPV